MEKDIGKIAKNADTDIIIRIDDFGGSSGLTIREFVNSEGYKGFTKAGVRIKADKFEDFKRMINSVSPQDFSQGESKPVSSPQKADDEASGMGDDGLM